MARCGPREEAQVSLFLETGIGGGGGTIKSERRRKRWVWGRVQASKCSETGPCAERVS